VRVTSPDSLDAIVGRRRVGEVVQLDVTSRSGRATRPVTLRGAARLRLQTYERAGRTPTPEMLAFRRAWWGSRAGN
jgi:hypothetical protein